MGQASVSKSWNAGEVLNADDLNQNFTDLVNATNDIDNANVSATAGILPTKLDDASSSAANHDATADPYASQTQQLPTDIQGELRQLRYQIGQLSRAANWYRDIAYPHARNLLRNGSFDLWTDSAANPEQWVDTATVPQTVTRANAQNTATNPEGEGYELQLTGEAATANTGLQQTLTALRASTAYILTARVRISTGTARLRTTGATTNVDVTTTSSNMTTLMAEFTTDATGTDVVVQVLASAAGDAVIFDHVACYCANMELVPQPQPHIAEKSGATAGTAIAATETDWDFDGVGTDTLAVTVKVPGPGYYIKVRARVCGFQTSSNGTVQVMLNEGVTVRDRIYITLVINEGFSGYLEWIDFNPASGAHTYDISGITHAGTTTPQGDHDDVDLTNPISWMRAEVLPYG